MGSLAGKVAIVTGAGQGIGRSEALLLAAEGAAVVVNDRGAVGPDGVKRSAAAEFVVEEIRAAGGRAVANYGDVSVWDDARGMIEQALGEYGRLDMLVCNAGIVRDRALYNMSEADWDSVVAVHLKGHFAPLHFAAQHWRE